ncbi:hypothetical protein Efla_002019 [Eimeria flavescens]
MSRWVSGDSAGRICFFDCSGGSRLVRPYIPGWRSSSSSSSGSSTVSSSGGCSYYEKLLQSPCSCLTFSGGWGGYDESEVTLGTSDGGIFALSSQWPSTAAAAAAAAASAGIAVDDDSTSKSYVDFPRTEGKGEVLRCASLPYCVLLVQMLGVHTPELRRMMEFAEASGRAAALAETEAAYPGLRNRQLLAVDKGGNGLVLDWCGSSSTSAYEAAELRDFSLREPLCCCCSNSLLLQQLAVASATAASFLSVYDIEANAFCFYAHVPPAAAATQTILRCGSSSSSSCHMVSGSVSCGGAAAAAAPSCSSSSTRVPVYSEVASPWIRRGTDPAAAPQRSSSRSSSKLQQQVCTSVSWVPRLGPSVLCGVTADALLLLYDTRASSFPVFITSTMAARGPLRAPKEAQSVGSPRPMVFVGAQPGLVAAHDELEAAVLPCCCCCCCCVTCKQQQQQQQPEKRQQDSLFEGHRGRVVLKPHATYRRKHKPRSSSSSMDKSDSLPVLSSKLQQRITEEFEALVLAHRRQASATSQSESSSKKARRRSATPPATSDSADSAADAATRTSSSRSSSSSSGREKELLRGRDSWELGLVALTSSSDSFLTSFPALSRSPQQHAQQKQQQEQQQDQQLVQQQRRDASLPAEVFSWLATACYGLVASSMAFLLTEKHKVRRALLRHTQQQLLLLLRSSCQPPETPQPSVYAAAAAAVAALTSKSRSNSCNGSHSGKASTALAAAASTRPPKKPRLKAAAAAAAPEKAAETAAVADGSLCPAAAAAAAGPAAPQDVLQEFAGRVLLLLQLIDPAESGSSSSGMRQHQQVQQQVQELLPLLLQQQQQNVLRLLEYCAAFSFCFSQSFLRGGQLQGRPAPHSVPAKAATPTADALMQQSELPTLLLQRAAKEVLRRFRKLAFAAKGTSAAAAAAAAGSFVERLQMGFGLGSQQVHLLFSVLLCWLVQPPQDSKAQQQEKTEDEEKGSSSSSMLDSQQNRTPSTAAAAAAVQIPELHVQRNCICRLPISDAHYFSIAKQQRSSRTSRRRRSDSSRTSKSKPPSSCSSSNSSNTHADTAQIICCDTAGEISVLQVTVHRFNSQGEKQLHLQRTAGASAAAGGGGASAAAAAGGVPQEEGLSHEREDDLLAKAHIWFPQLPALCSADSTKTPAAAVKEEALGKRGKAVEGAGCSCRCCTCSYSVQVEMSFLAPRSSTSSSNLSVHSNGSYLLLASADPYFALYCINPSLPPYCGNSRSRVPPLLGLALPSVDAAPQQHAGADVVQPLLLSAAPLLPCVPLPTCLPPYLAAPPVPASQVSLQLRFQQQVLQQQQAAAAPSARLRVAAWDTAVEFSDWLSEPEDPGWTHSDGE